MPEPICAYNVVVYLSRPVGGVHRLSTTDHGRESLFAESVRSAALKFYWRLGSEEREHARRIIVWAHKPFAGAVAVYGGPTVVFERAGGQWVEVEVRA